MLAYLQDRLAWPICWCCHTEIQIADRTCHFTQSQYTDTRPTSLSAESVTPKAWQGNAWSTNFKSLIILNLKKCLTGNCLFVGCLTSQQHASVSQGWICTDKCMCCHTEIEVADPIFHLTQSQHTDTGSTSPSTDTKMPGTWHGSHWSANFEVTGMTQPQKNPGASRIWTQDLPLSRRMP